MKPILIGIFYKLANVNKFLERSFDDLKHIDLYKNEVYFLGDFNFNLLLNDKFNLKENQSLDFWNLSSPLVSKYKGLCQTFYGNQEPTPVTTTLPPLLTISWLMLAGEYHKKE